MSTCSEAWCIARVERGCAASSGLSWAGLALLHVPRSGGAQRDPQPGRRAQHLPGAVSEGRRGRGRGPKGLAELLRSHPDVRTFLQVRHPPIADHWRTCAPSTRLEPYHALPMNGRQRQGRDQRGQRGPACLGRSSPSDADASLATRTTDVAVSLRSRLCRPSSIEQRNWRASRPP